MTKLDHLRQALGHLGHAMHHLDAAAELGAVELGELAAMQAVIGARGRLEERVVELEQLEREDRG